MTGWTDGHWPIPRHLVNLGKPEERNRAHERPGGGRTGMYLYVKCSTVGNRNRDHHYSQPQAATSSTSNTSSQIFQCFWPYAILKYLHHRSRPGPHLSFTLGQFPGNKPPPPFGYTSRTQHSQRTFGKGSTKLTSILSEI